LIGRTEFLIRIVGDGPERAALEKKVRELSLTDQVQFHGLLPQAAAADLLRDSDVMVLPSMRECGGAVVLEAMASGVPVIATDWGGPADYITAATGILIPPGTPERFTDKLADTIVWMADNPKARVEMGQAAKLRAQSLFDWHVKAKALLTIYDDVVGRKVA
jgi:glycosyltransferase involved in cell wall biosynthesis